MDAYFNKQLTERERIGHDWKFREVRNCKGNAAFDEDAVGGKESIHRRRRETTVRRKQFSENLNPLRSFIHRNVGRPWDKVFSELNKVFDRRKVVNDHIFVHLFDYVEINAKLVDGKVCVLHTYRNYSAVEEGFYAKRWVPIKQDSCEWYVHPVDGLLKANTGKVSKKARKEAGEKARAEALDKVFKVVDAGHHLYLEDGVWKLYTIKDKPAPVETLVAPRGMTDWQFRLLSKADRAAVGVMKLVEPGIHEVYPPNVGFSKQIPRTRYYSACQTASRKVLKQFNLVGTAEFKEDENTRSHREMSKYR